MKEIISRQQPYADLTAQHTIIYAVMVQKIPPKRPGRIPAGNKNDDELWTLLNECWKWDPKDRPTAGEVGETVSRFCKPGADAMS
jgi:hypothetical protein